jgi:uncharacterized protein YukE
MIRTGLLLTVAAVLLLAIPQPHMTMAGTTSEDVTQKTHEALETLKAYMVEKKSDAVAYGKTLLAKMDAEIEELQNKAAGATGDAKAAYQEAIEDLKQKRAEAAKKLDALGHASAESWDDAKAGFSEAYKALYEAYRKALANFK